MTAGTEEVDYLDGVTAKDSNGNDITANIARDPSAVDLTTAGEYEIIYTVTDENGFTATQTAAATVEEKSSNSAKKNDSKTDFTAKNNNRSSSNGSSNSSSNSNVASSGTTSGSNASGGNSSNVSGDSDGLRGLSSFWNLRRYR